MDNSITFREILWGYAWESPQFLVCCSTGKVESLFKFSAPGIYPLPRNPLWKVRKCRFLSIFKNSCLGFQATNFNLATGIFKVFSQNFSKKL